LFEYAMHPAQYEAYKSGKAKEDFLADVEKRQSDQFKNAGENTSTTSKPQTLTVQVNGEAYRVMVAYGDIELKASATVGDEVPKGPGTDVVSPLEGKFFLTKNTQETPRKVGDKVKKGDLLGYVEAMKTYNAIRADVDGTITVICMKSGDSVSEDDVLMKIG
ncbi:MAG: oxaloacetate decarboxylase, partial [Prevotellaceae bacterium]|nr:oxaloacetate decarboxylase [Prevotellaceae bacterium]